MKYILIALLFYSTIITSLLLDERHFNDRIVEQILISYSLCKDN